MDEPGIKLRQGSESSRIEIECPHQSGVLYTVPGDASWVCSLELLHAHALAGFFGELVDLDLTKVNQAMQRWGLYYRRRPLMNQEGGQDPEKTTSEHTT